jgi:endonuclease/exonuclease/phosphatase family metal-dependent hydrolase
MARKNSKFSLLMWLIFSGISGGGITGYLNPSIPIIGPLIAKFTDKGQNLTAGTGNLLTESANGLLSNQPPSSYGSSAVAGRLASARQPANGRQQGNIQAATAAGSQGNGNLLIASFNIQVLGQSKISKPGMKELLAHVIRQFDLVAIQEIRAKADNVVPDLVTTINSNGSRYNFVIGPRLGRSNSKEQYTYVFNTNTVEHDPSSVGTVNDPKDLLHREPFVTRFRARTQSPAQAFTFWMVNIHTDPDEVPEEVDALADVFQVMQKVRADEDDVILLGDLNASEKQLGRLGKLPGMQWTVSGVTTNTRSREQALQVSDHLPVWAEFRVWEAPPPTSPVGRPSIYN